MSEAAVVGEGTEVNKGENARMASFMGALAIGKIDSFCTLLNPTNFFFFCKIKKITTLHLNCLKKKPFLFGYHIIFLYFVDSG